MPCQIQCKGFPLTEKELNKIWDTTRAEKEFPDDHVTVQCVDAEEIRRLNREYRHKDTPTNILTFSYTEDHEHDVAVCMSIAQQEAKARESTDRQYVALLVVHAFLHICGMDHERSKEEAMHTEELERKILLVSGFVPNALSDVY